MSIMSQVPEGGAFGSRSLKYWARGPSEVEHPSIDHATDKRTHSNAVRPATS